MDNLFFDSESSSYVKNSSKQDTKSLTRGQNSLYGHNIIQNALHELLIDFYKRNSSPKKYNSCKDKWNARDYFVKKEGRKKFQECHEKIITAK